MATAASWWNEATSARIALALTLAGLLLLAWESWQARSGRALEQRRARDVLLALLGLASAAAYINFGWFHFVSVVQARDTFHYYIGAKYFSELGYDGLYECTLVADSELPALQARLGQRKIRDLRSNLLVPGTEILSHPERCKERFTPARWAAFAHDTSWFREHLNPGTWEGMLRDHGYNGTPVWHVAASLLTRIGPASDARIGALIAIDLALQVGMILLVAWTFGWRVACVALLVYGTFFPSRFYWMGGAFLRHDWIFCIVAGICMARRGRPLLSGALFGYAALLRIFPVFLLGGPLLAAGVGLWTRRRLDRRFLALFAGAALAAAVLVPISLVTSGGTQAYAAFLQNTRKHASTPLSNYMGLPTLVAFRPSEIARILRDTALEDPWGPWKSARLRAAREARLPYALLVLGYLVLLGRAVRGAEPWVACALGATLIAVGVEITCYYYSFIVAVALLHERRREVGPILLGLTALVGVIAWATDLPSWAGIPSLKWWADEIFTAMSAVTLLAFGWILWLFGRDRDVGAARP